MSEPIDRQTLEDQIAAAYFPWTSYAYWLAMRDWRTPIFRAEE